MTIERKVGMGIAGQPSGATDVADVFSTYLYTGTGSAQTITNGIDLAGEGGLVWSKNRGLAEDHCLTDTVRGAGNYLLSSATNAQQTDGNIASFNSSGYVFTGNGRGNYNNYNYASWTFRKKSGFFDCVTYSGNSVAGRQISHALSGPVGMIISKCTSEDGQYWHVFHRSAGHVSNAALHAGTVGLNLNTNGDRQIGSNDFWGGTLPTSTYFSVGAGNDSNNITGKTYVAYVFADNSAEDAEEQMIKCGSYTGTGASVGASVTLGWEPQFVLVKAATAAGSWAMMDTMRGIPNNADNPTFFADTNATEVSQANWLEINSTGFKTLNGNYANGNASGVTYIYMAIRAPMMKEPEAATDVFNTQAYTGGGEGPVAGFKTDFSITGLLSGSDKFYTSARITGSTTLKTNTTAAEAQQGASAPWDRMDGNMHTDSSGYSYWAWQRAKGYMDVVAYTGNGTNPQDVHHSLSVIPEMVWHKKRSATSVWKIWHKDAQAGGDEDDGLQFDNGTIRADAFYTINITGNSDYIRMGSSGSNFNGSGITYVAYLFATLAGISKVGSYTGNGSNQTIDCGFSAGARFILIKRTDATGDWYFWDSLRGIVAGNDPHTSLNTTAAQVTNDDSVDPHNSGFIVNQVSATNINVSSGTYIFYAIA